MIVDTSAWIEYLRASGTNADRTINQTLRAGGILLMPAVVLQELLQGAKSPLHYVRLQKELEAAFIRGVLGRVGPMRAEQESERLRRHAHPHTNQDEQK